MRIVKVNKDSIANILSDLLKRSPTNYGDFQDKVDAIIKNEIGRASCRERV